ncbi:unnamed protein product [Closterium sp. Yama58-4]|nr:unnamed protein product [Closterium sp. Yama58-4]
MTGTATQHPRTKPLQQSWSRTPGACLREEIATAATTTTIPLGEWAEREEAAEAQRHQHHLSQRATTTTCRKLSHSIVMTAPSPDCSYSGSTPQPQRRHVSSSREIRAKLSLDHIARSGARQWMRRLKRLSPEILGCWSTAQRSRSKGPLGQVGLPREDHSGRHN